MTEASLEKLRALLAGYAERKAAAPALRAGGAAEQKRRACADSLRNVVRPVLDKFMAELKAAGHEASTRDHTEREDAYPSVALSFTPKGALASALMFKFDPKHGIAVQRDVKAAPGKGRVGASSGDMIGTIKIDAVSAQWVATKTLSFVEDVLKAN